MKKRISILCAAFFCAALSAQETGVQAAGQVDGQATATADAPLIPAALLIPAATVPADIQASTEPEKTDTAAADTAATAKEVLEAGVVADSATPAVQAEEPQPAAAQVQEAVVAPAPPLTRADSAMGVYRSARDSIIAANRKFPRPPRSQQAADTAKALGNPDSALALASETIRSAWAAMGVLLPPREQQAPDAVKTAVMPPRGSETQAQISAPGPKPFKAQAALGMIIPLVSDFKPWWNMGFHASYREIDADARFSKGLSLDLSLYTFSEKEYKKYYESDRDDISISGLTPMFIVDLGYCLKFYPVDMHRIPYITGAAGAGGSFGGNAKVTYNGLSEKEDENLVDDIYLLYASVGVGADVPVYAGIRAFAEIQYALRFGLFSITTSGGLVSQLPIRFGVVVPFGAFSEIF